MIDDKVLGKLTPNETSELFREIWDYWFSESQREQFVEEHAEYLRENLPEGE